MTLPVLRMPVSADLAQLEQSMERGKSLITTATRAMVQSFAKMNAEIVAGGAAATGAYVSGWARAAAGVAAQALAVRLAWVAAAAVIASAIGQVGDELEKMLAIARKSANSGVSPEFFQAFVAGARGAEDQVKLFEKAIDRAFQATKDVIKPDWSVWDQGIVKVTAIEAALRDMRELFTASQTFTALDLFRGAGNQDQKIMAVLTGMKELEAIGQRVAALDLAEKMFGAEFADKVRLGQVSVDRLMKTIEEKSRNAGDNEIISNAVVLRAKELDDRLNDAWNTIKNNLNPSMETFSSMVLKVKEYWTEIVELIAKASKVQTPRELDEARRDIITTDAADSTAAGFVNPFLQRQRRRILANRGVFETTPPGMFSEFTDFPGIPQSGAGVPFPRSRPPTQEQSQSAETVSAYDTEIDRLKRRAALLEADASAVGKTAAEHDRLRAEMQLLQAAEKDSEEITQEQITKYAELRATMDPLQALQAAGIKLTGEQAAAFQQLPDRIQRVTEKNREATRAFQGVQDAARGMASTITTALDGILDRTQSVGDAVAQVFKALRSEMLKAFLAGEGFLAGLLGTKGQDGRAGGLLGSLFASLLGGAPGRAEGGPVQAGKVYRIRERGLDEFFTPGADGYVGTRAPNAGGGDGGVQINVQNLGGPPPQITSQRGPDGRTIVNMVVGEIKRSIATGGFNDVMGGQFGVRPKVRPA